MWVLYYINVQYTTMTFSNQHQELLCYCFSQVEGFAVGCEFSPDGTLLVTGSSDGKVFFYNYHTSRIIRTLSAHKEACVSAIFHPVLPSLLATCDWAGEIKIWQ